MIPRTRFARVLDFVNSSGAADYVESLLRPCGRGGRPRQISFAVFLAALVLAHSERPNLSLVNVHKVLTGDLARSYQIALNIITTSSTGEQHVLTLRQVRYMLEAIESKLAYTQGRAPFLADADRATRKDALQRVLDLLMEGTLPTHLPRPASVTLDGTGFDSWAVGKTRRPVSADADHAPQGDRPEAHSATSESGYSFDPDAAYGYQTKTYDNRADYCFGYHAFAILAVPDVGADPDTWPKLAERITIRPANASATEPALAIIDSLLAANHSITELLSDREFTYKRYESWGGPLRERGIAQVLDMHHGDRGIRDYNGIAMIDGVPHCLAVLGDRDDLICIARPAHLSPGSLRVGATEQERAEHEARVADINAFRAKIGEREVAAFRRVAGPDATGKERWECPAQAGKVICDNCPFSLAYPEGTPKVAVPHEVPALPDPPARPGPRSTKAEKAAYRSAKAEWNRQAEYLQCCRQRTVTIPGDVTPKLRQGHYWGSTPWIASYSRRGHSEGFFGNLKDPKTSALKRGQFFVVGIVKCTIMVAAVTISTNIRILRSWADRTGDRTHPLAALESPSLGFEELASDGTPDLAIPPPRAA